jgi:target of rapamycin complex subunit LST8
MQGNVYVWKMANNRDITTITPTTKFTAHSKYLIRCLLSSDVKHLATCSADTTVKIWSTENDAFRLETKLEGHQRWVWDCAFSADSAYLVTGLSPCNNDLQ